MMILDDDLTSVCLMRYMIASGDMFFSEIQQRGIFVGDDGEGRLGIWAESEECACPSRIDLFRVFLEFGLYCGSMYPIEEACGRMEAFGQELGQHLGAYLSRRPGLLARGNAAVGALECLFGMVHSRFVEDRTASAVRFVVTECPLEQEARRSGLPHVELARYGINAMCERLCHEIAPSLIIDAVPPTRPQFVFTLALPVAA